MPDVGERFCLENSRLNWLSVDDYVLAGFGGPPEIGDRGVRRRVAEIRGDE